MIPSHPRLFALAGANALRAELGIRLEKELPAGYYVFYRVSLAGAQPDDGELGAFDFLVLAPDGSFLLILVVEGDIIQNETGITTRLDHYDERPVRLAKRTLRWIDSALTQDLKGENIQPGEFLLYFPKQPINDDARKAIGAERVVDALQRAELVARIQSLLSSMRSVNQMPIDSARLRHKLCDHLRISRLTGDDAPARGNFVSRRNDPMRFIDDMHMNPFRIRLRAVAGAGKTALGVRRFLSSTSVSKSALFLSQDATLIAWLQPKAGKSGKAFAWFDFVRSFLDEAGFPRPDFSQVGNDASMWEELADELFESALPAKWRLDTLIVDDGHVFRAAWWPFLRGFIGPQTHVIWLEDLRLSKAEPVHADLAKYIGFDVNTTQRTPWRLTRFIHDVTGQALATTNPLPGWPVAVHGYNDPAQQIDIVVREVARLRREGFTYDDIVIISFGDIHKSALIKINQIGDAKLRRLEEPISDKSILYVSLDEFAGREAAAVIVMDVNTGISATDVHADHIYHAATRATVALTFVTLMGNPLTKVLLEHGESLTI